MPGRRIGCQLLAGLLVLIIASNLAVAQQICTSDTQCWRGGQPTQVACQGDTLVVTVTGQNDSTWFDRAGNFHSADMKVVERWHLTGPGVMRYEAEITDPATFTRPWKISLNLYQRQGEDARLQQFKCVEFVEELMYGKLRREPLP